MKFFLRIMSVLYLLGGFIHLTDLFGLRLNFQEMSFTWKIWIIFLLIGDFVAAIGMWKLKRFGEYSFLIIAISQLIAYIGFSSTFGQQHFLIGFHIICLTIYGYLRFKMKKKCSVDGREIQLLK